MLASMAGHKQLRNHVFGFPPTIVEILQKRYIFSKKRIFFPKNAYRYFQKTHDFFQKTHIAPKSSFFSPKTLLTTINQYFHHFVCAFIGANICFLECMCLHQKLYRATWCEPFLYSKLCLCGFRFALI